MSRGVFRCLLAAAALGGTASEGMAQSYVNDPFPTVRSVKWSGFYAGFQGGYSFSNFSGTSGPFPGLATETYNLKSDGWLGGVHLGYNYQFGHYLIGAEIDVEGMNHSTQSVGSFGTPRRNDVDWQSSLRARLGWVEGPWLFYGTGGWVFAGGDSQIGPVSFGNRYSGWTAGLGLERAVTNNASLRIEYRYTDFGTSKFSDATVVTQDKVSVHDNALRMGLSFRF